MILSNPQRPSTLVLGALVFLAAALIFSGTLAHEFVWDDRHIISYGEQIVQRHGLSGLLAAPYITRPDDPTDKSGYYRPVPFLSFWLNGEDPAFFHLLNIFLHAANSVLVFLFLQALLPGGKGALPGALLFALHPVHAESVAWISGRTDLFALTFLLVALNLWFRIGSTRSSFRPYAFILAMAAFFLACLSKETVFAFPLVAAFFKAVNREKGPAEQGDRWLEGRTWFAGWVGVLAAVIVIRIFISGAGPGSGQILMGADRVLAEGFFSRLAQIPANLTQYLHLLFFPLPLSVYYPPMKGGASLFSLAIASAGVALCLGFSGKKQERMGALSLVWILTFLLPVSGILDLGLSGVAERFCYLPSVGVSILFGYLAGTVLSRKGGRLPFKAILAGLFLILAAGTFHHASRWKNEVVLFQSAISSSPYPVANLHFNLGNALLEKGRIEESVEAFDKALSINPGFTRARLNLAAATIRTGDHDKALEIYREIADGQPDNWDAIYNMAVVLELLNRPDEALEKYYLAMELDPSGALAGVSAGRLLARLGRVEESMETYRMVLAANPSDLSALEGLALACEQSGLYGKAADAYLELLKAAPDQLVPFLGLGRSFAAQGRFREAAAVYRAALGTFPSEPDVHRGLVLSLRQDGRAQEASDHIKEIRGTDPNLAAELSELLEQAGGRDKVGDDR